MLALYRSGRQADALAAYRSAREAFVEGLGIEPGAELKALERQVLDQDPALAAPPGEAATPRAGPRRRRRVRTAMLVGLAVATVAVVAALRDGEAPLLAPPNSVAVIDPKSNRVTDVIAVGTRPGPIAAGSGAVWTGNLDDKTLTRIDPAARRMIGTTTLAATPTGVAAAFAAVWVAHGLTGQISRVDPQLGGIRQFAAAGTRQRSVVGAVAPGSESVWAVFGDATLARVNPRTTAVERTFAGSRPTAVAEGGGGLWVVSSGDSTVYRFNPATFLAGPIGRTSVGRRSTGIAYGHDAVWVTSSGDNLVTRIDPGTNSTRQIPVGEEPVAVAVDERGGVGCERRRRHRLPHRSCLGQGGRNDRGRGVTGRDRRRAWTRLGDGPGALAFQADGRQDERGPEQRAAGACREERRLVEDEERHDRSGVSCEFEVELGRMPCGGRRRAGGPRRRICWTYSGSPKRARLVPPASCVSSRRLM